jgi:N-acetyl sugar amidotransferase
MSAYQICTRCVMDTSDPNITFNEQGVCSHCLSFDQKIKAVPHSHGNSDKLRDDLIAKLKKEGKGKKYDCIVGVSGGVDSTYVCYIAAKAGLRCLAVHLDNGWNSELAVSNIEKTITACGFDLYTHVINWEEFKDMQRSYIKASVVDIEAITDHAIIAILYEMANKYNTRYILNGSNTVTEATLPTAWYYNKQDAQNIVDIHAKFGTVPISSFPLLRRWRSIYFREVKKITHVNFLDYYDYNKDEAKQIIIRELGWVDYGGKHYESIFTRFYQAYILPRKFKFDKRRAHLSTLVSSGQMERSEALAELEKDPYPPQLLSQDLDFVLKKLDFTPEEFSRILTEPIRSHTEFKHQLPFSMAFPALTRTLRKLFK